MFYTGIRRESKEALKNQAQAIENLHQVKEIGREIKASLTSCNLSQFASLLDLHWQRKKERSGTTNPQINQWYDIAREAGATGGKLLGAGGGGFFVFYCEGDKDKLRKAMTGQGLKETPFRFDFEGVKTIANFI